MQVQLADGSLSLLLLLLLSSRTDTFTPQTSLVCSDPILLDMGILFLIHFLVVAASVGLLWSMLLTQIELALRSQRDLQAPVTLDQILSLGVNMNSLVFDQAKYSSSSIPILYSLLDSGVRSFALDAYYNQYTSQWQLCPGPIARNFTANATTTVFADGRLFECNPTFNIALLMLSMRAYFLETNTTLEANFIEVLFSLKPIVALPAYDLLNNSLGPDPAFAFSPPASWGTSLLAEALGPAQPFIYTPTDMRSQGLSTGSNTRPAQLNVTLFSTFRRMLVNAYEVSPALGYNFTEDDLLMIFFQHDVPTTLLNTLDTELYNICVNSLNLVFQGTANMLALGDSLKQPRFDYVSDTSRDPFTEATLSNYARCGFSPILNTLAKPSYNLTSSTSLAQLVAGFIQPSLWSWAPGQPTPVPNDTSLLDDGSDALNTSVATRCGALYPDGWHVDNCYREYRYACQNILDPLQWLVPQAKRLYFDIFQDHACTGEWRPGVPRLAREQLALLNEIGLANATYPVWIDVNDVTVDGCFVSGGPYAQCPYIRQVDVKTFVKMLAPAAAVSLFVILLLFLERFCRFLPIRAHRKHYWKKRIAEESKTAEPEGVPL